ncbi:nucleotidyltransferase domain-containing protein [Sphingobium limneticum]|uniref:Nucleotidyltransferase family protein n=2 Tax=Pseudomonadota TaxID=1224 RepID=A0A5J5I8Y8_9SPHN|nr:nucleotidyltransferase family protein [Sphingobium limneticum]KAA9020935.1 nucleotidyltransferase family protein [Sphingobium limneticum]KAA9033262.1 nucleotidyltransferase family protein [Sphingobium limneticum]
MSAALLVQVLRDPAQAGRLDAEGWNRLLAAARAERLIGTLAYRLDDVAVPDAARLVLTDAKRDTAREGQQALWEADRAADAMRGLDVKPILLKGTAYVAADLRAGQGRFIGDLDILVPRDAMPAVERALIAAGWEWVKEDPYDDAYYRQWMHELPPMIHVERDRMIDVHHTVLPLTARQTPDAIAMIADAIPIANGLYILSAEDRIVHSVAHMLADGDMQGGLRNLWDIHCLLPDADPAALEARAARHGLARHVGQARRLAGALYGDGARLTLWDRLVRARLLARNGWGQESRKLLVFAFYIRSHWLRIPPAMLMRHLWTKWRKGHRPQ